MMGDMEKRKKILFCYMIFVIHYFFALSGIF